MRNLACGDLTRTEKGLKLRKLVTDRKVHVFLGLVSRGEGKWRRVWDYWNQNVPLFGGKDQKKKFLTSSPVEALTLFFEEHQGLLKLEVPLGWEWGRME